MNIDEFDPGRDSPIGGLYPATNQVGWEVQFLSVHGWSTVCPGICYAKREDAEFDMEAAKKAAEELGVELRVYSALNFKGRVI